MGKSPISDDGMSRNYTFSAWHLGKVAHTGNVFVLSEGYGIKA